MRKQLLSLCVGVTLSAFTACSVATDDLGLQPLSETRVQTLATAFPQPDASVKLSGHNNEQVKTLLALVDTARARVLGETVITPTQLAEIKTFTDSIVSGATTQKAKYDIIFHWVSRNVRYGVGNTTDYTTFNTAYTTFKGKQANCQGYSNLLKVMCYTQGIPALVANGALNNRDGSFFGGHAWNYVCADGEWWVSDPTNSEHYVMNDVAAYIRFLTPERLDITLFEDDAFSCVFEKSHVTVYQVKPTTRTDLTVPYSIGGVQITSFNPISIPASVKNIYLGSNIEKLGEQDNTRLPDCGGNLEHLFIDSLNTSLEDFHGTIYAKGGSNIPLYIPGALENVVIKAIRTMEKNTIYGHRGMKTLTISEGTKFIRPYAVEDCPNLETVYLPTSATSVSETAFMGCSPKLQIIKGGTTGIARIYK